MTKSDLILRDIDLLKQFQNCIVALSLSITNDKIKKDLEPLSSSTEKRIEVLKKIHQAKIPTALFISPIFPKITNWQKIIYQTKPFVDEYWFENLNLYPSIKNNIYSFLKKYYPELIDKYKEIYSKNSNYWQNEEKKIKEFCKKVKVNHRIYFHHSFIKE